MFGSRLWDFFPPPKYLDVPVVGLDISDQSIKFIDLERRRGRFVIKQFGETAVPVGAIQSGEVRNKEELIAALRGLRQKFRLTAAAASLPEEAAYIAPLTLPPLAADEIRDSLELQLEEHVPLKIADSIFDYEIIGQTESALEVVVTVFPRRIAALYAEVLTAAGFQPAAFEIEAHAIARSVVTRGDRSIFMIVDFGKTRTSFFVVREWQVFFTSTTGNIGGQDITRAVQKNLQLDESAAERLKIERGFLPGADNRDLFTAVAPLVSVLRDEINKQLDYWDDRSDGRRSVIGPVEKVILCGGQATLPGLVDYLNTSLSVPVALGNAWANIFDFDDYIPSINLNQSLRYTTSLGLVLRRFAAVV